MIGTEAGDGNQAGARKQTGVANQASAEKAKRGTAQPANRSHQAAQADRSPKKTTVASAGHSSQAKQTSQHNKKVAAPQATRHAQPVAHRPPKREPSRRRPRRAVGLLPTPSSPPKRKRRSTGKRGKAAGGSRRHPTRIRKQAHIRLLCACFATIPSSLGLTLSPV